MSLKVAHHYLDVLGVSTLEALQAVPADALVAAPAAVHKRVPQKVPAARGLTASSCPPRWRRRAPLPHRPSRCWPASTATRRATLVFNRRDQVQDDPQREHRLVWAGQDSAPGMTAGSVAGVKASGAQSAGASLSSPVLTK